MKEKCVWKNLKDSNKNAFVSQQLGLARSNQNVLMMNCLAKNSWHNFQLPDQCHADHTNEMMPIRHRKN
jgi:hypothetical protein